MQRLLAVGDIHGCYRTFYELIFNRLKLKREDRLILLGDYIDRGPMSREVIDLIMSLIKENYNIKALSGNHEQMLVDAYDNPGMLPLWLMNDGTTTLESFGADNIRDLSRTYIDFFRNLGYFHREGEFLFAHAGFNDDAEDPFTDTNAMLWESRLSYLNPALGNMRIIHGHRPKQLEFVKSLISTKNQVIPVDTGCVYGMEMKYGYLSAIDLTHMELVSVGKMDD